MSGVVVRRCGFDRRPAPFSGHLSTWPAFGTPGGAWSRSGTGSRPGWGKPAFHTDAPELGLGVSGGCPAGGGGFLGPYPAVGLLEWEAVDKYMSFRRVHLRVGGATAKVRGGKKLKKGLSPRGRGNPTVCSSPAMLVRSIPAWAGEPGLSDQPVFVDRVYPRVGGGNRSRIVGQGQSGGSIPAWAGEPRTGWPRRFTTQVYPRVGGGTLKAHP